MSLALGGMKTSRRTNQRATLKASWWKILLSVVACALVDVMLHKLFGPRLEYNFPPSIFVEKGLFLPAASVALILWFGTLTIVFALIQDFNLCFSDESRDWGTAPSPAPSRGAAMTDPFIFVKN